MYKIYRHKGRNNRFIIENLSISKETTWCYYDELQSASFCDILTPYSHARREFLFQTTSLEDFFNENPTFEELQINHPEFFI